VKTWTGLNWLKIYLTFIGPCIVIYSYSITNKTHLSLTLFFVKRSTCFGLSFRPSSGAHNYVYSKYTSNSCCYLLLIIYSCKTLYMFRTVFPSTIRCSKLRIQQRYMSNSCCYLLLAAGSSSCLTYACCCIRSYELLMVDGKTVRNMKSVLQE